ncbi:unnamed protein product [Litomosoides sigmodontis]|uniref:Uncharacterized protein n=1 Tax=Litomosoides sigmodontis TaxID=42156 RepID=A0A3P6U6Z9_LITSI|nr:unnamed protein product [Litomosoides sigmodontis]
MSDFGRFVVFDSWEALTVGFKLGIIKMGFNVALTGISQTVGSVPSEIKDRSGNDCKRTLLLCGAAIVNSSDCETIYLRMS